MRGVAIFGLMALAACSDALDQDTTAGQVIAVAEGQPSTVSLVSAGNFAVSQTIALPAGASGPVSGLENALIVPIVGGVAVIDLAQSVTAVSGIVSLAPSGISRGSAIQDDAVAWLTYDMTAPPAAKPHAVWRVNYRTGDTASVGFGANPKAVALAAGHIFVVTVGAGDVSWLTVLDTALTTGSPRITVVDSIPLTGLNARGITLGGDGYLYVASGGPLTGGGATPGRLSIVDPLLRLEVAVVNGLGEGLGAPVYHPSGRILIPSSDGIVEVNPATRSLTRGPSNGVKPDGDSPNVLVVDQRGRLYALVDHCADPGAPPGAVHVLSPPPEYTLRTTIRIGSCPVGAATAAIP
jgi:hypothetical protein